jgi:hypothetical protein
MSSTSLTYNPEQMNQSLMREPTEVLAEARKAAVALQDVISKKKKPVMFNGEQYIEREDWGTVARFYGCTAKVEETRYISIGEVHGYEAVAVCLDRNQNIISRAESMCLSDEDNWGMVAEYEWKDKVGEDGKKVWDEKGGKGGKGAYIRERVKVGEKAKPLFQLRSMAQTRAEAKVLKSVFGFVVVLAGYQPSVAEEMTGNEQPRNDAEEPRAAVQKPQRASEVVIEQVSGTIQDAKFNSKGELWMYLGDKLTKVPEPLISDDMVNGNVMTINAKKGKAEKVGEFWLTVEVVKCEKVTEGVVVEDQTAVVSAEDEVQEHPADVPESTPQTEELKTMFDNGDLKTGREVAVKKEETDKKKEQSWRAHAGHDPMKHMSFKQFNLLMMIISKRKLKDEDVKALLLEDFGVEHRYLFPKDRFADLLDMLDPNFEYHDKPKD